MRHWRTLLLVMGISTTALGQQQDFRKTDSGEQIAFAYRWQDNQLREHSITFNLAKTDLNQPFNHLPSYSPDVAQRYVHMAMLERAQQIDPREARVSIQKLGQQLRIGVRSRSAELRQKWQRQMADEQQQAFDQYLQELYFDHYTAPFGQQGVKPDHVRFALESVDALRPVGQALYEQVNSNNGNRPYIDLVLSWVQSIPYDELGNRLTSNGSGYAPPLSVVSNNLGDCDSKTVLTAALIRSLLPGLSMHFIYLTDHALLAAALPHRGDEAFIRIGSSDYLLLEPTGPAQLPAGQIGQRSQQGIAGGLFTTEAVR